MENKKLATSKETTKPTETKPNGKGKQPKAHEEEQEPHARRLLSSDKVYSAMTRPANRSWTSGA